VIVFRTLGAPLRAPRRGRRPKPLEASAAEPEPVALSRATVVAADSFASEDAARAWLDEACRDEARREEEVAWALRSLNRAVHAQRIAAADPYVHDVCRSQARQVRLGFGTGDELVEGRWHEARALPDPGSKRSRRRLLSPQEELSGILSGRRPLHVSEDLALRARLDLEQGRLSEAALQARVALDALIAELERDEGADPAREALAWARSSETGASELARAGAAGDLEQEQAEALEQLVDSLERLLRRRRHSAR
jgi:hypothetical protein